MPVLLTERYKKLTEREPPKNAEEAQKRFDDNISYADLSLVSRNNPHMGKAKEYFVDTQKRKEINEANRAGIGHPLNELLDKAFDPSSADFISTRTDTHNIWGDNEEVTLPYHLSTSLWKNYVPPEHIGETGLIRTYMLNKKGDSIAVPNNYGGFELPDGTYMEENEIIHPRNQRYRIIWRNGDVYLVEPVRE